MGLFKNSSGELGSGCCYARFGLQLHPSETWWLWGYFDQDEHDNDANIKDDDHHNHHDKVGKHHDDNDKDDNHDADHDNKADNQDNHDNDAAHYDHHDKDNDHHDHDDKDDYKKQWPRRLAWWRPWWSDPNLVVGESDTDATAVPGQGGEGGFLLLLHGVLLDLVSSWKYARKG